MKKIEYNEHRLIGHQLRALRRKSEGVDFLVDVVAQDFSHRLQAINRDFDKAIDLYSLSGLVSAHLEKLENIASIERFELPKVAAILGAYSTQKVHPLSRHSGGKGWPSNIDLVVSAFGLQFGGELEQELSNVHACMNADGLLLAALPVRGTLFELHDSLARAELELCDGAAMRVGPFIELQSIGQALQNTGFKLPVVDREDLTVRYADMFGLIADLRSMGVNYPPIDSGRMAAHRELFTRANEIYSEHYSDADGRIRANFSIGYITAWVAHDSQQKPLKPGSAEFSLAEHLKLN